MAVIILPNRGNSVPPLFSGVNWDSPQARGLMAWYPLATPYASDALTGRAVTYSNMSGADCLPTPDARFAYQFSGPYADEFLTIPGHPLSDSFLITAWARPTGFSDDPRIVGSSGRTFEFYASPLKLYIDASIYGGTYGLTANKTAFVSVRRNAANQIYIGLDGQETLAVTTATSITPTGWRIGGLYVGARGGWEGRLWDVRFYHRPTEQLRSAIYNAPTRYDLYWVPSRRAYIDLGATPVTRAPGLGSATLTGAAGSLSFNPGDYIYSTATPDDEAVVELTDLQTPGSGTWTMKVRGRVN